ncbi:MAG: ABC transporter ATP-binding protein [Spirochaetales bacterium]|nr:ABC transporter ATP-binding protein [Spirochaetales bacterium]
MSELILDRVVKSYGKLRAVDDLSLEVRDGELLTLLGPSGCGKTTTLRAVSGFVPLESGRIFIGQRNITEIPPERRGIGLVFQNYALWPHMNVFRNLAFGLQLKKLPRETIKERVEAGLATVKLSGFEDRFPRQLSGGQQQRVALARALVLEPDILLLDEPLSNLDALLREQMRFEIAQIHKQLGITSIYVTHDQTEAMVISDRIAVMNQGKLVQLGTPAEIYSFPSSKFVAGFMGTTTFVHGRVVQVRGERITVRSDSGLSIHGIGRQLSDGDDVDVAVRPENIRFLIGPENGRARGKENTFEARVTRASYVGELIDYQLDLKGSLLRAKGETAHPLAEGAAIRIHIEPQQLSILKV